MIICSTSFVDIAHQLEELGQHPSCFAVSPILNDLIAAEALENQTVDLLVASGLAPRKDGGGGGLYRVSASNHEIEIKKIYSGKCHSILSHDGKYFVTDSHFGVLVFDNELGLINKSPLPKAHRTHGIAYSSLTDMFYLGCSHSDTVVKLTQSLTVAGEIRISQKFPNTGEPHHHLNDTLIVGESLYQSMFSLSGNWKREVFDGGILEIDLETEQVVGSLCDNLWMPHSVSVVEGAITVLDSLRGELLTNNFQRIGKFPGFSRGLCYANGVFYIGQSKNRNFSKTIGVSDNISLDTSIIVFDPVTKLSKSIPLPGSIPGIHA